REQTPVERPDDAIPDETREPGCCWVGHVVAATLAIAPEGVDLRLLVDERVVVDGDPVPLLEVRDRVLGEVPIPAVDLEFRLRRGRGAWGRHGARGDRRGEGGDGRRRGARGRCRLRRAARRSEATQRRERPERGEPSEER